MARQPRRSKNGTPEERAAKASTAATVIRPGLGAVSFALANRELGGRQLRRPYFGSTTFLITSFDKWITSSLSRAFSSRNASISARSSSGPVWRGARGSLVPGGEFALPMSSPLKKVVYSPSISESICVDCKMLMTWRGTALRIVSSQRHSPTNFCTLVYSASTIHQLRRLEFATENQRGPPVATLRKFHSPAWAVYY